MDARRASATREKRLRPYVALGLFAVAAACSGSKGDGGQGTPPSADGGMDGGAVTTQQVIGPDGGTITGPDGAQLVIPPGALAQPTTITVKIPDGQAATAKGMMAWEFQPDGLTFAKPATF